MATYSTGLIDIGTLTNQQRNELVFELLNYEEDATSTVRQSPMTEVGEATLADYQRELFSNFDHGGMNERVSEALISWEADLYDSIWFIMDQHIHDISAGLESAVATALVTELTKFKSGIGDMDNNTGTLMRLKPSADAMYNQPDNDAMRCLETSLSIALPNAVNNALRINLDTRELKETIWSVCREFILSTVVANAARGIYDAEVALTGFSAPSSLLDGPSPSEAENGTNHG